MACFSIYQVVHTLDGQIYNLEEHLQILKSGYSTLWGGRLSLTHSHLESIIRGAITQNRPPKGVSLFVEISLSQGGEIAVATLQRSIYCGYTLRCLSPVVIPMEFEIPHIELPTSTRREIFQWCDHLAQRRGANYALRSSGGLIDMIAGAQIFGVRGEVVVTAAKSDSVEHALVKAAVPKLGMKLVERAMEIRYLEQFDELFFADHYGVTAIRSCMGRIYMSITANAVATQLKQQMHLKG